MSHTHTHTLSSCSPTLRVPLFSRGHVKLPLCLVATVDNMKMPKSTEAVTLLDTFPLGVLHKLDLTQSMNFPAGHCAGEGSGITQRCCCTFQSLCFLTWKAPPAALVSSALRPEGPGGQCEPCTNAKRSGAAPALLSQPRAQARGGLGLCVLCLSLSSASKGNNLHPGVKGKGQKDTKEEARGKTRNITSHYGNAGPQ